MFKRNCNVYALALFFFILKNIFTQNYFFPYFLFALLQLNAVLYGLYFAQRQLDLGCHSIYTKTIFNSNILQIGHWHRGKKGNERGQLCSCIKNFHKDHMLCHSRDSVNVFLTIIILIYWFVLQMLIKKKYNKILFNEKCHVEWRLINKTYIWNIKQRTYKDTVELSKRIWNAFLHSRYCLTLNRLLQ